jgi:hypothetical protein
LEGDIPSWSLTLNMKGHPSKEWSPILMPRDVESGKVFRRWLFLSQVEWRQKW